MKRVSALRGHERRRPRRRRARPRRRRGLVRHQQQIVHQRQRVRPHVGVWQLRLDDELRLSRIGDVDASEVGGRRLVRDVQHATPAGGGLERDPFAAVAEAAEVMVRQQAHLLRFRATFGHRARSLVSSRRRDGTLTFCSP